MGLRRSQNVRFRRPPAPRFWQKRACSHDTPLSHRLSTTSRGLLPGAPVPTRTGLSPVSLNQLAGRNMIPRYAGPAEAEPERTADRAADDEWRA